MRDTRLRKIIRHTLLTFFAVLSIIFSWVIWTNPARYERSQQVTNEKVQTSQENHALSDVIVPVQTIYTNQKQKQELINNDTEPVTDLIVKQVSKWKLRNDRLVARNNKERYLDYLNLRNSVMLKYNSNITGQVFNDTFDQKIGTKDEFGRIIINLDKTGEVYLLNDNNYNVYQLDATKQQVDKVDKLVKQAKTTYQVKQVLQNHHMMTYFTDANEIPNYSYILNTINVNNLVSNLLSDEGTGTVNTKKESAGINYTDSDIKKRLFVSTSGQLVFNDSTHTSENKADMATLLEKYFYQIRDLQIPIDNVRYFDYYSDEKRIEFLNYVGGFPILNADNLSAIEVQGKSNQRVTTFSNYTLEVPVPAKSKTTHVPSTQAMLDQLQVSGIDLSKVKDIELGYEWDGRVKSGEIVNLTPTWYVKYEGKWQPYMNLIS